MSSPQTVYAQPYMSDYKSKEGSCAMAVIGVIVAVIVVVAVIIVDSMSENFVVVLKNKKRSEF